MRGMFAIGSAVVLTLAAAGVARAQSDAFAGTWKLNLAKSKYYAGTPPKSEVRTYEVQGDGERLTVNGVAADGSPVSWGYSVRFDGKDYPITGSGPNGADAIAVRRVNARTVEARLKKGGKIMETASRVVSEDGKTITAKAKTAGPSGTLLFVIVYDKQ